MPVRAASLICAVVAVVVCAWFALGIRQAIDTGRASAIVSGANVISAAQARRALALLHNARALNPDRQVEILRAEALLQRGEPRRARTILIPVARDEPQNLEAWLELAAASGSNRPMLRRALARAHALEPIIPRR